MDNNLARNDAAKGMIDMACYDLMGQITDLPACYFMGGKFVEKIPLAALIPLGHPMLMKRLVRSFYKRGYRNFRLKLGKSVKDDVEIVRSIRKIFEEEINIRVDYNQAYNPSTAVRAN